MGLSLGDQIGNFKILEFIGAGGMGQVYKARDVRLDRLVAIKVVSETLSGRFEREARAISGLNHPHICTLYDVGPGYLVMELVEGQTLAALLKRGSLPLEVALCYGAEIAEALAAAHAKGIIHRDLKPGNIMVNEGRHIKVLDFGLAKLREGNREQPDATVTATGVLMGTPGYMAPEQALGHPSDQRSDVFSLGVVLYEMVTGRRPFAGSSSVDVLHALVHSNPKPVQPPELQWILEKALAKDPEERYESIREFAVDMRRLLRRVKAGDHAAGRTVASPVKATNWKLAVAAAAAGIGMTGILWFFVHRRQPPPAEAYLRPEASISRITSYGGTERSPAVSPDGRYFAFVSDHGGTPDIWVRRVSGGEPVRLTQDEAHEGGLVYAPNGESLYFTSRGGIWSIGALGGNVRKIVEQGHSPAPSPDGAELAYVRDGSIYVGTVEGSGPRRLTPAAPVAHLSWSPDGNWPSVPTLMRQCSWL